MSWQQVTTQEQMEVYQSVLDTEQAYDGSSVEGLQRLLRRGAELWLWDNQRFQVALALEVRNGQARVVNAVPAGQCTGVQSCRVIITKIREYVDRVDVARFEADLKDPRLQQQLNADQQEGQQIGVRGTPTIFVNGRRLPQRSRAAFDQLIKAELDKVQAAQ